MKFLIAINAYIRSQKIVIFLYYLIYCFIFFPLFLFEIIFYKLRKKNSNFSYQYMIKIFILTGGWSNILISKFLCYKKGIIYNQNSNNNNIYLGKNISDINTEIKSKGYCVLPELLSEEVIENLNCKLISCRGKYKSDIYSSIEDETLDIENPKGTKFEYNKNELIEFEEVQKIFFDKKLLKIIENYLDGLPIIDILASWWNFPSVEADHAAAQLWHFDMDRPKWLKVFIYLTDCKDDNGPHCYINSTNNNGKIPFKIRSYGYARLNDKLIENYYEKKEIKTFTAKKGTILIEDTRGLHKGLKVEKGNRLLLQCQYSSSLFGSQIDKIKFPKNITDSLVKIKKDNLKMFENFYE
ncbi:hypothetical protein MCEMIE29_00221 [Candidatus Pelagibacterales bacterium]